MDASFKKQTSSHEKTIAKAAADFTILVDKQSAAEEHQKYLYQEVNHFNGVVVTVNERYNHTEQRLYDTSCELKAAETTAAELGNNFHQARLTRGRSIGASGLSSLEKDYGITEGTPTLWKYAINDEPYLLHNVADADNII